MKLSDLRKHCKTAEALGGSLMLDYRGSVFVSIEENGDVSLSTTLNTVGDDWEFYSGKEGDSLCRPRVWSEWDEGIGMREANNRLKEKAQ